MERYLKPDIHRANIPTTPQHASKEYGTRSAKIHTRKANKIQSMVTAWSISVASDGFMKLITTSNRHHGCAELNFCLLFQNLLHSTLQVL